LNSIVGTNVTVTTPETIIQGTDDNNLPLLVVASIAAAVMASAGGYLYVDRHRRTQDRALRAGRPDRSMMARLPAPTVHDEEEEAAAVPRETSRADWSKLVEDVGAQTAPAPEPFPPADASPTVTTREGDVSFDDIPVVISVPVVAITASRSRKTESPDTSPSRHGAPGPVPARLRPADSPPPRPQQPLPVSRPPASPPPTTRTAASEAAKKSETIEDILAMLNEKKG
jgi:hypothetical protein